MTFDRHHESSTFASAPVEAVFARLDDHTRLSAHMSQPSWRMGGGQMSIALDAGRGQAIGSHIVLAGRVLGVSLFVDEVVTLREPPRRKEWETVGTPRLLVIGAYRMGFELTPEASGSRLRIFIDYELPRDGLGRWLGLLFGGWYARWCTERMARDAAESFAAPGAK